MPAGWVAAAGAVIGGVATYAGAQETADAADRAGERTGEASAAALRRSEEAFQMGEAALSPYALQEQVASSQLMSQMGLAPPGGGGGAGMTAGGTAGGGGGDGWGFGATAGSDPIDPETFPRTGNVTQEQIRQVFREYASREPTDYELNYYIDHGGASELHRDMIEPGPYVRTTAWYDGSGPQEFRGDIIEQPEGGPQAGGPGGPEGGAEMMGGEPGAGGGAPEAQTIDDIMSRAGADQLPPELREQYLQDLMGTTVGNEYQETGAYQAAREAGIETVDQGAAGRGGLYSGARGKALRDVGQDVEQRYYQMAQQQANTEASRRGGAYQAEQQRGQSYYNNYMQMLTSMSDPRTTTNIEQMRQGSAQAQGANIMGTARDIGELEVGAAGATQAAYGDAAGGMMKMGEAWIGSM